MAKDLNLEALLKRGKLRAWDAAQLMIRHLIEERTGPAYKGFLRPEEVQALKVNLPHSEIEAYNAFMRLYNELEHNLLRATATLGGFQWMTFHLEQILDQFRIAAEITEELGYRLDALGKEGEEIKDALGFRLFWIAPLAIAWPVGAALAVKNGTRPADEASANPFGKDEDGARTDSAKRFEYARNADITPLAVRFRQDNPYRVGIWQNVLAYEALFKLAESVLGIDYWAKGFETVKAVAVQDKTRFEAKAVYLDCLLKRAVRDNTDPMTNPAAVRLNAATLAAMSEEDRAALVSFYPDFETELYEIDEDIALGELLDETGTPKDLDRVAELLAGRIEERRREVAELAEEARARMTAAGSGADDDPAAYMGKEAAEHMAAMPVYYGWYASVNLDEIAKRPEGETAKDKALAWLAAEDTERTQPLSLQDPALVGRWIAKREELRPTVSADVLGPKAYDGFLREAVLTDLKPTPTRGLDPQAYEEFRAHLESFRQYAPAG
jgi:hypothetical protein